MRSMKGEKRDAQLQHRIDRWEAENLPLGFECRKCGDGKNLRRLRGPHIRPGRIYMCLGCKKKMNPYHYRRSANADDESPF